MASRRYGTKKKDICAITDSFKGKESHLYQEVWFQIKTLPIIDSFRFRVQIEKDHLVDFVSAEDSNALICI